MTSFILALCFSGAVAAAVPLPPSPDKAILPEPYPSAPSATATTLPADLAGRRDRLTLSDVVDVALRTDPRTRAAWLSARAAADDAASRLAPYWPQVGADVSASRAKLAGQGGRFVNTATTYGPLVRLDWVLLDFGSRSGDAEDARRTALAAVWAHGGAIQDTVLATVQAYVTYNDARALLDAARTNLKEAEINLEAAQKRREAGLATIADVLQARTAVSQSRLDVVGLEGTIAVRRGALATAMGLPVTTTFDVGELPAQVPAAAVGSEVDQLIQEALTRRPDLAAARDNWLAAEARVRKAKGDGLPRLSLSGTVGRTYFDPALTARYADPWSVSLLLHVPLFTGFETKYNVAKAREEAGAAAAGAADVERLVVLDVWASYYALRTAAERIETVKDLLAAAEESEKVALARYKEGVGTILDLLNAQAVLASARAQAIAARSDWLSAAASLARSTGALDGPAAVRAE